MPQELKTIPEAPRPERIERAPDKEGETRPHREMPSPQEHGFAPTEGFVVPTTEEPGAQIPVPSPPKPPEVQEIETILEEDLSEMYDRLPADRQAAFKKKGEEVTHKVVSVLHQARARAKDILGWIRDWLRIIPGVNKFFLEQESKIKTDKIVALSERKK